MNVTYDGPYDEVQVAKAGQEWLVKKGESVDLPDDVAAGLEGQEAWTVTAPKTPGRKATTNKDGDS